MQQLPAAPSLAIQSEFVTVDQMLDGLEASADRLASTLDTPPLDVKTLRYLYGAARQFLPRRPTLTERLLDRRKE